MFNSQVYSQDPKQSQLRNSQNVNNEMEIYENQFSARVIYSRKLYSKLLLQMIVISAFTWFVYKFPTLDTYLESKPWIFWVAVVLCIGTSTLVFFIRTQCKAFPINWILFTIFTLSASVVAATLVALGDSAIGLLVFVSLASMIFFLFIYALTVKKRLTYQGSILFLSASILIVFELFTIFTKVSLFWLILVSLATFFVAFLLIYDTYTNVNSGDQYDVTLEDDVSASVVIYWDIILLFLRMNELIKDYLIRNRN